MRGSFPSGVLLVLLAILPASAGAEPLRFLWPVPGKVKVTERAIKQGNEVVMSYQVSLAPAAGGKRVGVRLTGFEFLEVNGRDARTPAIRKQLAEALRMVSAIPTLVVNRDGIFHEITGMDELIGKLTASLPAGEKAAVRKAMSSPQFAGMLQEAS